MDQAFEKKLHKHNVLYPGQSILLAVSGGVDSVVLLHLMQKLVDTYPLKLSIAHVNHQLRPEADAEEQFVRELAEIYGIPIYVYRWEKSMHPKSGFEEAARHVRYQFFKKTMNEHGADTLMTGHHQDDQVETILMKLTRGSSLEQLTGIEFAQPFHQGQLIRPLLSFTKKDIYLFADEWHLKHVEDETNQTLDYSRNRFRNRIIPLLKEENKQLNTHIEQFAKDITDALEISKQPIQEAYDALVVADEDTWIFSYKDLFELGEAMQRAVLQTVLENLYTQANVSYKTTYIELIREWLSTGEVNTQLDLLGGFTVNKGYQQVVFSKVETQESSTKAAEQHLLKQLNQWVELSSTESIGLFEYEGEEVGDDLVFQAGQISLPLTIRHRKPGDRMSYAGLAGTKKIKDIFIDEKTPIDKRDEAWLVEDNSGKILWLIPYRKMYLLSDVETDKLTYILKYKTLKI